MSQRFPNLTSQFELNHAKRHHDSGVRALVLSLAQVPSLPWFEILLGTAFLMAMRMI